MYAEFGRGVLHTFDRDVHIYTIPIKGIRGNIQPVAPGLLHIVIRFISVRIQIYLDKWIANLFHRALSKGITYQYICCIYT